MNYESSRTTFKSSFLNESSGLVQRPVFLFTIFVMYIQVLKCWEVQKMDTCNHIGIIYLLFYVTVSNNTSIFVLSWSRTYCSASTFTDAASEESLRCVGWGRDLYDPLQHQQCLNIWIIDKDVHPTLILRIFLRRTFTSSRPHTPHTKFIMSFEVSWTRSALTTSPRFSVWCPSGQSSSSQEMSCGMCSQESFLSCVWLLLSGWCSAWRFQAAC